MSRIVIAWTLAPAVVALVRDRGRHRDRTGPVVARQSRDVGRISQRDRRHVPRDVADVVGAAAAVVAHRPGQRCGTRFRSPVFARAKLLLQRRGRAPGPPHPTVGMPTLLMLTHAASAIGRLKCRGHARAEHARRQQLHAGHLRGALRDRIACLPQLLDLADTSSGGSSTRPRPFAGRRSAGRRRW